MKKVNLFIDMDGVLAKHQEDLVDFMYDKGFFLNRPPVHSMIEAVKRLTKENYDVYILTTVVGNEYCEPEKGLWLDKYLPEVPKENRLFVPPNVVKADFVNEKVHVKDSINILLDDFTVNLNTWDFDGALPVKVLNGLNNNFGTWLNNGGKYIQAYNDVDVTIRTIKHLIHLQQIRLFKGYLSRASKARYRRA